MTDEGRAQQAPDPRATVLPEDLRRVEAAGRLAISLGISLEAAQEAIMRAADAEPKEHQHYMVDLNPVQRPTVRSAWSTGWHALLVDLPPALCLVVTGWIGRLAAAITRTLEAFGQWLTEPARAASARRRETSVRFQILEQRLRAFQATDDEIDDLGMLIASGMPTPTMLRIAHHRAAGRRVLLEDEAPRGDFGEDPLVHRVRRDP